MDERCLMPDCEFPAWAILEIPVCYKHCGVEHRAARETMAKLNRILNDPEIPATSAGESHGE